MSTSNNKQSLFGQKTLVWAEALQKKLFQLCSPLPYLLYPKLLLASS